MGDAIRVKAVSRRFGALAAVDELSFTVQEGEIFGLLGPNGAGKTTTVNLIAGLLKRDAGEIQVLEWDPAADPRKVRRRIGLVPQETNAYLDLSATDNLWHHAALYCDDLSTAGERIESLLDMMNLWERRGDPVRTYSGGMKRRLVLARALLHDPEIILFDEPTLGVDVQGRHVLWDHIRASCKAGKTFVISTNDMTEADKLCDQLLIIDHGRAVTAGPPEALKAAMGQDVVTLRTTPPIDNPAALFEGLGVQAFRFLERDVIRLEVAEAERRVGDLAERAAAEHQLEWLRVARPSLDDVFLHHTGRALRE